MEPLTRNACLWVMVAAASLSIRFRSIGNNGTDSNCMNIHCVQKHTDYALISSLFRSQRKRSEGVHCFVSFTFQLIYSAIVNMILIAFIDVSWTTLYFISTAIVFINEMVVCVCVCDQWKLPTMARLQILISIETEPYQIWIAILQRTHERMRALAYVRLFAWTG